MTKEIKSTFLKQLAAQYGALRKLDKSDSLYEIGATGARVYIRYSKVHAGNKTWYGLRAEDLQRLEGHPSIVCFLWDNQIDPLCIPFLEYEDVFQSLAPAGDGQYKAQVLLQNDGTELYIARAGRFNVEGHLGWESIDAVVNSVKRDLMPELSHSQVQTLLGAIGAAKGYDVWIPLNDRSKLDWTLAPRFDCREVLPYDLVAARDSLQEVDVTWIHRGATDLKALFEVEHSSPVYSGLLRFNDIHLVAPSIRPRFSVVANDTRRSLFVRQLRRPTFQVSGLGELCTFLEYADVFGWYNRVKLLSPSSAQPDQHP